jgi:hypothetical protein
VMADRVIGFCDEASDAFNGRRASWRIGPADG